ncbi:MAG: tetratricopeptide repeat protein [Alphaproteobacteria bacterium]|nr:tetratricopeptide repeat protein [Alphaproteobacteria bacterium]
MKSAVAFALTLALIGSAADLGFAAPSDAEIQKAARQCFGKEPTNWTTMANACTVIVNLQEASASNKARAYYNRGSAYLRLGGGQNAYEDFTAAINLVPKFPMALVARAGILAGRGKYDQAIVDLDKAIAADPKFAPAYSDRGMAYAGKKDFDKAIVDLNKAVELNPTDPDSYAVRGSAYAMSGDNKKALADLNKAILMNPRAVTALYNRGKVYAAMKDAANAKADFKAVLAIDPDNQLAKDELKTLGGA